jgi:hypothetical protein
MGDKLHKRPQDAQKNRLNRHSAILFLALGVFSIQSATPGFKVWRETTIADFSDNLLENVIISANADGEIRLPYPMVKISSDSINENVLRFTDTDSAGNYVTSWNDGGNVFARKCSASKIPLTPALQVNEPDKPIDSSGQSRVALLDEGSFMVTWTGPMIQDADTIPIYGQIFDYQGTRVEQNILLNEDENSSDRLGIPVANNIDNEFYVMIEMYDGTSSKIHIDRYDAYARKIGKPLRLNPESIHAYEMNPEAQMNRDGKLTVVWLGYSGSVCNQSTLYLRRLDHELNPLGPAVKVNDTQPYFTEASPDISLDNQGRNLVVWLDDRNHGGHGTNLDVYAQLFDSGGTVIGANFMVNDDHAIDGRYPDADFINGQFQMSWLSWDEEKRIYWLYANRWICRPVRSGTMTSSIFDLGPSGGRLIDLSWHSKIQAETSIRFKLRSTKRIDEMSTAIWFGPADTSGFYLDSTGQDINPIHQGDRFIQYKTYLATAVPGISPELRDVTVTFAPYDTVPPSPPPNLLAGPGHSQIRLGWDPSPDADVNCYRIHRGTASHQYDADWTREVTSNTFGFTDSSAQTGTAYYYAVTAVDSGYNESLFSNQALAVPYGITVFVDSEGSAVGDGSIAHPFNKIQDAIDLAIFGDDVQVLPGVYTESVEMKDGISLIGAGPNVTRIEGGDRRCIVRGANHASLQGFTIARIHSAVYDAVTCDNASPTIMKNVLMNEGQILDGSSGVGCYNGASPVISKNYILFWWAGVQCYSRSNATITNNIMRGHGGISAVDSSHTKIVNNTIIVEQNNGGDFLSGSSPVVRNNIIYGNSPEGPTFGLLFQRTGSAAIGYNDVWNVTDPYEGVAPGTGDIAADPLVTSLIKNDFRLRAGSPCIDTGDPDPVMNDRDQSRNDMGAFGGPDPIDPTLLSGVPVELAFVSASGFPGDTVATEVTMSNTAGLSNARFEVSFDPAFIMPIRAETTALTDHFQLQSQILGDGKLLIAMTAPAELGEGPGTLCRLFFAIRNDHSDRQSSPLLFGGISLSGNSDYPIRLKTITNGVILANRRGKGPYVYVDGRNTGKEDGSRYCPFHTIQKGIDHASFGDTVLVSAGVYTDPLKMKSGIFVLGMGAYATAIERRNDSINFNAPLVRFEGVENSGISGFTFLNRVNESASIIRCSGSSCQILKNRIETPNLGCGVLCDGGSRLVLSDNYILGGAGGMGGTVEVDYSSAMIQRNVISSTGTASGINGYRSSGGLISNNKFYVGRGESAGVQLDHSDSIAISNNLFIHRGDDGIGILLIESNDITVLNNTLDTALRGIQAINSRTTVLNNIVTGNIGYGISLSMTSSASHNDVWDNALDYYTTSPGQNDLNLDPLFIDPSKEQYALRADSPCRDRGNPAPEYNDLDGSRNDIGLYGGPGLDTSMFDLNGIRLSIGSLDGKAGDTLCVPIQGKSLETISDMEMMVSYSPQALSLASVQTTRSTEAFSLSTTELSDHLLKIHMSNSEGFTCSAGDIAELFFVVNDSLKARTYIRFEGADFRTVNTCEAPITELQGGQITVTQDWVDEEGIPTMNYSLDQNYPNPFNSSTTIRYSIPRTERITLKVYNLMGQEVAILDDGRRAGGMHDIHWNADGFPSGMYIYRLNAGKYNESKKILLLK